MGTHHIDFKEIEKEIDILLDKVEKHSEDKDTFSITTPSSTPVSLEKISNPLGIHLEQETKENTEDKPRVTQKNRGLSSTLQKIKKKKIKLRIKKKEENGMKKREKKVEEEKGNEEEKLTNTVEAKEEGNPEKIDEEKTMNTSILLDEDLKKFLSIVDNLLGKLPEDVIQEFAESEDFLIYERVMKKYNVG